MGKNRRKRYKTYEISKNIDEKVKYVIPIDELDINCLQSNYYKFKLRNNDNVVPIWSLQQNSSNYYEFEIIGRSKENSECHEGMEGTSNSVNDMTNEPSTVTNNKMNIITKLNKISESIDFTTYMKLVNVFNESDDVIAEIASDQDSFEDVIKKEGPSFEDQEETATNKDVNTDQLVTVHVLSGEKLNVSMSNFHGIWKSRDHVQCRLCMVMVEDVEAHKMEIRHMKRIASPVNNKHCIRKIGPIWNHCMLCNETIENIEFHLEASTTHIKHLERASKQSEKRQSKSICCTTSEDSTFKSSLLSYPEIKNTNVTQPTNNPSQNVEKSVIKKLESISNKADHTTIAEDNDTGHFSSNGNESFCNVCNLIMFSTQLKSHIEGKSHKAQLLKIKNEGMKEVIINRNFENGSEEKETKSSNHKPKENSKDTSNDHVNDSNKSHLTLDKRLLTSDECKDVAFCHVCNRKMQSDQLREHTNGKSHKARLLESKNEGGVKINPHLCSGSEVQITKPNEYQLKYNYVPDKTGIQNFKIQKGKEQINVVANATDKMRMEFADEKKILKSNECENVAFCNVCNRKMLSHQFDAHINGKAHKAQLQKVNIKNEGIKEIAINSDLLRVSGVKNTRSNEFRPEQNSILFSNKTDVHNVKILKDNETKNVEVNVNAKEVINIQANSTDKKPLVVDNNNKKSVITINEYVTCCNMKLPINSLKSHEEGEHHKAMLDNKAKSKDIAEKAAVELDSECRMSENYHHLFQKNFKRRLYNCNRYDEILFNSAIDTFSELRSSTSSTRYTNQPKYSVKVIEEAVRSSPVNDKPKNICNTYKIKNLNYLMTFSSKSKLVFCKVCCNSFYSKTEECVLRHFENETHIKKYTRVLEKNLIKLVKENTLYCEACNVFMYVGTELVHIETDHHKRETVTKLKSSTFTNKRIIYCDICDTISFVDSILYIEKCCSAEIFYKNSIVIVEVDKLYCRYCSKYLHYSEVLSHILTPEHLYTDQADLPTPYTICSQIRDNLCQVCKESVFSRETVYHILLHLDWDYHRIKYKNLLIDNNIEKQGDLLYCKPCKVYIELRNEIDHIDQISHREMLKKNNVVPLILFSLGCITFASLFYFSYWKKNDLVKVAESRWMQPAQDRSVWTSLGEAFLQQWTKFAEWTSFGW